MYTYPGFSPFVVRVAERLGFRDGLKVHEAKSGPHVKRITQMLATLTEQRALEDKGHAPAGSTAATIQDYLWPERMGLALQMLAVDEAIREVLTELGIELPEPLRPKATTNAAEHIRPTGDRGERNDVGATEIRRTVRGPNKDGRRKSTAR